MARNLYSRKVIGTVILVVIGLILGGAMMFGG